MAIFPFRWPGLSGRKRAEDSGAAATQPPSIELLRRRARHRLIGAALLVLLGVAGFPLLFDTQPRPVPVDLAIVIPDRNKAAPLQIAPATPTTGAGEASSAAPPPPVQPAAPVEPPPAAPASRAAPAPAPVAAPAQAPVAATASLGEREQIVPPASKAPPDSASKPAPAPARTASAAIKKEAPSKPEALAAGKPASRAEATAATSKGRADDGARAQALLDGKPTPAPSAASAAGESRFVVQVGAYTDPDKLREARAKVERIGLKTYTQVIESKDGKRTRVRVGPFATKAEADRAAGRIKALDLPAAILSL